MAATTALAIRTLHVLTVTVLVGASAALWHGYRTGTLTDLGPARRYEWLFWAGLGVLALTGVGNLGALGAPGPATAWGRVLLGKLLVVLALVLGSAVRALLVVRLDGTDGASTDREANATPETAVGAMTTAYGATTGLLLGLVVLAEVLAHG